MYCMRIPFEEVKELVDFTKKKKGIQIGASKNAELSLIGNTG